MTLVYLCSALNANRLRIPSRCTIASNQTLKIVYRMPKSKSNYPKAKPGSLLWAVGFWATIWWAVSCLYVLLVVWQGLNEYSEAAAGVSFVDAVGDVFSDSVILWPLFITIAVGWVIGGYIWLKELKKLKVPYRVAFKDLFLTIRK